MDARRAEDYGRFGLNWGYASSPLLHQGALYIQVLHGMKTDDPSYVMKVDGKSGKTVWKVNRPTHAIEESPDAYTTPLLVRTGKTAEIAVTGGDIVTGHHPETGRELWRASGLNPSNDPYYRIVASAIVAGDLIIAPSRNRPMLALKPGGSGDVTQSHKAWSFHLGPDVPSPISDGKLVYVVRDNGVVHALDVKTGAVVWGPQRLKTGAYSSSPVLADGKVYVTSENEGMTSVLPLGPSSKSSPRTRSTTTAWRHPPSRTARFSSAPTSSSGRSARARPARRTERTQSAINHRARRERREFGLVDAPMRPAAWRSPGSERERGPRISTPTTL